MLAWLITVFLSYNISWLILSRLLVGIGHALISTTVYTTEITSKDLRATLTLWEVVMRYSTKKAQTKEVALRIEIKT